MTITKTDPYQFTLTPEEGDEALFTEMAHRKLFPTLIQRTLDGRVSSIVLEFQHA
jgi:hypothetical protein